MKKFTLSQYDSKNTAFNREIFARDEASAENKARKISEKMFYPVVISSPAGWCKFEQGEKTAWGN